MPKSSTRHADILAVYDKHGGIMSLRRLTQLCAAEGVWTEEEQHNLAFAAMRRQVQQALQVKNSLGLPMAGPSQQTDAGAPIWVQLGLWDEDISLYNMALRLRGIEKDYDTLECLWRNHQARWGNAPPIPHWTYPDEAPLWWHDQPANGEPEPLDDEED